MEFRDTAKAFLGVGWQFPVGVDAATGRLKAASSDADIAQAVRIILLTSKGERMMQPEFGCNLRQYLFAEMDYTTCTQIGREVRDSLVRWEPRITDVEVEVDTNEADAARLILRVSYVVRATNNLYNLVFPYYISEGLEL